MCKLIATVAVALLLPVISHADIPSLDDKCKVLSDEIIKYMKDNRIVDYSVVTADSFHSRKFGTCIHTEIADSGEMFKIRELSKTIIKDGPDYFNTLFYCDRGGANSANLDVLKRHNGNVHGLSYREWLDDGFGGEPAAIKTPDKPYSNEMCKKLYVDWIKRLK